MKKSGTIDAEEGSHPLSTPITALLAGSYALTYVRLLATLAA
ncbi:hypothetical protein [Allopontixanthobacter confluentis]|nr:hypothetical protein [Allopontixanthobacter confluentis]